MSRALDDLRAPFRLKVFELIARCAEHSIPVYIVDTSRTDAEQAIYLAQGRSWTKYSKHLIGEAVDLAPYKQFDLHGPDKLQWDGTDPAWKVMADIGRALGLRCGADWSQRDYSHFEWVEPSPLKEA